MKISNFLYGAAIAASLTASCLTSAKADNNALENVPLFEISSKNSGINSGAHGHHYDHARAGGHAPIGVMGDHMHGQGEWMLSYRYMHMTMRGSRDGTNSIDPLTIATTVANPNPGPATFRVVPTDMTMEMHMLGGMYGITDWLTAMAMVNYTHKEMDHVTFLNGAGTAVKGTFTTESEGFGDIKLSGMVKLYEDKTHNIHLNAGISIPTGTITESDEVLPPPAAAGLTRLRLPYSMQIGTGTFDALPGLTYTGTTESWNWGAQYTAEIRLEDENSEGYAFGDKHSVTAWAGYDWTPWLNTSLRVIATTQDEISGSDSQITAPVQTADPDNYGGDTVDFALGANFVVPTGQLKNHRFAVEAILPAYRDLNGPQLETDFTLIGGWQYAF